MEQTELEASKRTRIVSQTNLPKALCTIPTDLGDFKNKSLFGLKKSHHTQTLTNCDTVQLLSTSLYIPARQVDLETSQSND